MTRIAAMIYELLLVTAVVFVASFIIAPVVGELHEPWQRHLFQGYILGVLFIYFSTFWLRSGQTLAMKTWRIRLVSRDGQTVRPAQAFLRFLFCWPSIVLGGIGIAWALVDRDQQFLHDRLAGTQLVMT